MALLFMEGFGRITESQLASGGRWTAQNVEGVSTSYKRYEGQGMYTNGNSEYLEKNDFPPETYQTMVFGFAIKLTEGTLPTLSASYPFFYVREGSVTHMKLCLDSSYQINVYNGDNTLLGTTVDTIAALGWYYIEFKVTVHNVDGSFELKVATAGGGTSTWLSDSGIDTRNGGDGYIRGFRLSCVYSNIDNYMDDIYVDDSDFHGNVKVSSSLPDGDGSHNDFTPVGESNRFECVDENTRNDDTDYVYAKASNSKQTFTFSSGTLKTVKGVQLTNAIGKDASGERLIKNLAVVGGNNHLEADSIDLGGKEYDYHSNIFENNPDTGLPWDQISIEASEFGLEIVT